MLARLALAALAVALFPTGSGHGGATAPTAQPAAHQRPATKPKPRHRAKARKKRTVPSKPAPAPPSVLVPDDPWWGSEWGLARIGLPGLWRATADHSGTGAVIAVVDTGVDATRADLAGAVLAGYGPTTDTVGHGSSVAEVAAARGDDGIGAAGVCWRCRILPVDVAPTGVATAAEIAAGIRYAADNGANVINLSMVLSGPDAGVADAVAYAQARGALVVAAAGNDGGSGPTYPAAYPGVLGVVAVDAADRLYPWSTHGPWAAFAAPGCATVADATGGAVEFCGSSAAAPLVSGLAGLLWSAGIGSADAVRAALAAAAVPLDGSIASGGRVDAAQLASHLGP
ncbi:MAG: S8 family serine peptidase [Gaiellaceae bacterium]